MFLHGGWDRILGNMLFLAIFGKNVEDAFGPLAYLVFYFAGCSAAMMTQTAMTLLFDPAQDARVPQLGARGAVAAVLGAHFVLYPGSQILTYIFRSRLAFFARVGGFIFGLLVVRLLARAGQAAPGKQWRSTARPRGILAATGETRRPSRTCAPTQDRV
jgi:membrane associated rhomboid family serine protease